MTEPTVDVTLRLPRRLYLILVRQAEEQRAQVAPMIVDGLERALRPKPKPEPDPDPPSARRAPYTRVTTAHIEQIRALHGEELGDAAIAERLGLTKTSVARYRRDHLKLPAIRRAP